MKQSINTLTVFSLIAAFAFVPPKHNIAGRWKTYETDGSFSYVDFNQNGTFKVVTTDGKIQHQGNYKFKDDVFSVNDKEGCGDTYWGTYNFNFVSEDSFLVAVINDSCTG
ncbi:MAG: hypothetical protein ACHQF0_05515 [Chitinophagales bacterium]